MILILLIIAPLSFASLVIHNETSNEVDVILENNCSPLEAKSTDHPINAHDSMSLDIQDNGQSLCILFKNTRSHLLSEPITNPNKCDIILSEKKTNDLHLQVHNSCTEHTD
jgi:hypothetical protein